MGASLGSLGSQQIQLLRLPQGAVWTSTAAQIVRCSSGLLWITDATTTDHILHPGEERCVTGRVVVEALEPGELLVGAALPAPTNTRGLLWGALGVLGFSFTLPMTRLAVAELDGTFVGLGRAVVAGVLAGMWLIATRQQIPTRAQWKRLTLVAGGAVVGFPLLSALALRHVPASHGAVLVGLTPAATATVSALRGGERPSRRFWLACLAGLLAVLAFAATCELHGLGLPDGLLLVGIGAAATGYAEGGALAKELGGPAVISWALVLTLPFVTLLVGSRLIHAPVHASAQAWAGFAYVSVISMFVAFLSWYRGLGEGGVARVSQLQLLQPVLTLLWSELLLGESIRPQNVVTALVVAGCVVATLRTRVQRG